MYHKSSLWKAIPVSLCDRVRHSTNTQEYHWHLRTDAITSGEAPNWARYTIHLQEKTIFCRETGTFPCPPLFWLFCENSWSGVTALLHGGRQIMITSWICITLFNSGRSFSTNPSPHCCMCSELDKALTVADQQIFRPWDYHGCN